ncbi:D-aminoacyl-tRNA deacylase [Candidatus Caldatribacterium sp.]|uniref:D-aminoacyl-tRNA deacylase n=1 Tax=Candidatus Caldatribacterium sp. TaxID=2282143 RepID=UPI0029916521|nr:D-aminoacyl-tRNA deacylase [Candidatus Caldatribacterium sp.]MDW8081540.1 D-aminoacyl-tRNA deacylase [Candidatus Calescibacterium sp.]
MRAVVQRVRKASVSVDGKIVGAIDRGLLVFLGVGKDDDEKDLEFMVWKIPRLRIFEDGEGKMNLSVLDVGGAILCVSQFTLYGDCRRGLRPSFDEAAPPDMARYYYEELIRRLRNEGVPVVSGIFGAFMAVELVNDGPVTILLESKERRRR